MKTKNYKNLFYCIGLGMALALLPHAACAQEAEVPADSTRTAVGERTADKVPTVAYKGKVTDAATGLPVQGAILQVAGDRRFSALTDEDGSFEIAVPLYATQLQAEAPAYAPVRLHLAGEGKSLDVKLYSEHFAADFAGDVRVTNRSAAEGFSLTSGLTVEDEMAQRLGADVRVLSRSGNPAQGANLFVGGFNSLNANAQPLIVLDGMVLDTQNGRQLMHTGYVNNVLSAISVNDIERVTVLKNATAIYGAKGANGVVIIETKRAKSMATRIDVDIYGQIELMPKLPKMMDATQYRSYVSDVIGNVTSVPEYLDDFTSDRQQYATYHNNTNWKDYVYREAFTQNYGVNVQGGDDVASYNLSIGYANAQSTLKDNDFSRLNMRFNTDVNVVKDLTCRLDVAYSNTTRDLRDDGFSGTSALLSPGALGLVKAPILSPYTADINGNITGMMADADNFGLSNPISILENGEASNKNHLEYNLFTLNVKPEWQITRQLAISQQASYILGNVTERYFIPDEGVPSYTTSTSDVVTDNQSKAYSSKQTTVQTDTRIDWANRYGGHYINVFGGYRFLSDAFNSDGIQADNSAGDKLPNITNEMENRHVDGVQEAWKSSMVYLSADYNFADKYFLQATVTGETSTRFGRNADGGMKIGKYVWGIFPSLQAAWVVSAEPFFRNVKGIDYLKFNVGIDQSGNDNIDCFASRTYFASTQFLNQTSGLALANIGNDQLKWERVTRVSAGFDMGLIDNRLSLGFNFYKSWVDDMLTQKSIGGVSGLDSYWCNDGKMENMGFDLSARARVLALKDFSWELFATVGHYKNEVTALPDDNSSIYTSAYGGTVVTQVGSPLGLFYGYKTQGVFATSEDAAAANLRKDTQRGALFGAGDMHFVDVNGDHIINDADRVVIGDPNPDVFGNFGTSLHYKNWTLDALFSYSLGNDIYNYQRSVLEGGGTYNQTQALLNRWTTEGQQTDVPRVDSSMGNSRFSDRWIEDGSYLKLKSLTLSYRFPFNYTFLQGITVWGAANNVFTCTKYLGGDPELSASGSPTMQGIDRGLLGSGRSFVLGVKVNL